MKKILVLCDDVWHPAEVIEKGFAPLQGKVADFDFVKDAKDILSEEMLGEYAMVINCKSNHLTNGNGAAWFEPGVTEVGPKEFETYIRNGGGFLALHAGNTYGSDNCPEMANLIGNAFVTHPARCDVKVTPVKDHPVTAGVEPFTVRDEHYEIKLLAEDIELLLQSESATGGKQTAGYVRTLGKGRLCVLTPGHILTVWQNPMFRKLLVNAINWCMQPAGE